VNEGPHGQWGYHWQMGDVYIQRLTLNLPDDASLGQYRLHIGLFDPIQLHSFGLNAPDGQRPFWPTPLQLE
jgi:hypothetical protein